MANWQETPQGTMNMDPSADEEASRALDVLIEMVLNSISQGGFSKNGVFGICFQWERIGTQLRSASYKMQAARFWLVHGPDNETGKKPSQYLLEKLRALKADAGDADAEYHAIAFNEAEFAVRMFVYEYRKALSRSDKGEWTAFENMLRHHSMGSLGIKG